MKLNKFLTYILISFAMVGLLIIRDFGITKKFALASDFLKPTPYIPMLNPSEKAYYNAVVGSPVTFWAHLPMPYDRVAVHLDLDNPHDIPVRIGFASIPDQSTVPYRQGMVLPLPQNPDVKFKLEFDGASPSSPVKIRKATLLFERDRYDLKKYLSVWMQNISKIF